MNLQITDKHHIFKYQRMPNCGHGSEMLSPHVQKPEKRIHGSSERSKKSFRIKMLSISILDVKRYPKAETNEGKK